MKAVVFTLGCKVNQYESFAIMQKLLAKGYEVSEELQPADLYVINTCAVTAEAERKSLQTYARVTSLNPNAKVIFCGCASQHSPQKFTQKADSVLVMGSYAKGGICNLTDKSGYIDVPMPAEYEDDLLPLKPRTRAYVKVQDGCNNFCSYCIIPYLRGRSRSRAKESVRSEMEGLIGECKEFILTGINLSDYGSKIGSSLTELLLYLKDLPVRIRLGSLEVGVITDHFLEATKKLQCFCPHFHLSLQSGSVKVLKEMNRKYTPEEFRAAVDRIRKYYPLAAITTDVIVGFATETEEDFEESLAFCRQMNFADMHVFPYSPRVGTVAHKLYKPIAKEVMRCRVAKMTAVKGESRALYEEAHIGLTANMLVEERLQNGDCIGYTENYLKCYLSGEATVNTVYPIRYIAKKEDGMEVEII